MQVIVDMVYRGGGLLTPPLGYLIINSLVSVKFVQSGHLYLICWNFILYHLRAFCSEGENNIDID